MKEALCPSHSTIDLIGTVLYLLLAIVVMIILVSRLWAYYQPSCQQVLFTPTAILFVVLIVLAPMAQVFTWYMLRIDGIQTTAVVIGHHISPDAKALYHNRIDFMYRISGLNGGTCTLIQQDEPVPAEVYTHHPIDSTITIWYSAQNPRVAHTESAERVAWSYAVIPFIVGAAGGLGAYLKQFKWL
jgi:hypothetical protein